MDYWDELHVPKNNLFFNHQRKGNVFPDRGDPFMLPSKYKQEMRLSDERGLRHIDRCWKSSCPIRRQWQKRLSRCANTTVKNICRPFKRQQDTVDKCYEGTACHAGFTDYDGGEEVFYA